MARIKLDSKKLKSFIRLLNNELVKLDTHFDINSGGCCYVAYVIAENFKKHKIPYKVVLFDYEKYDYAYTKLDLRQEFNSQGIETHNHFAIEVDGNLINPGTFKDCYAYKLSYIKPEGLYNTYIKGDWNYVYSSGNNERIKSYLDMFFTLYLVL